MPWRAGHRGACQPFRTRLGGEYAPGRPEGLQTRVGLLMTREQERALKIRASEIVMECLTASDQELEKLLVDRIATCTVVELRCAFSLLAGITVGMARALIGENWTEELAPMVYEGIGNDDPDH